MDQLITAAAEKIRSFQDRIDSLKLLRFPSENPKLLVRLFSRICQSLRTKLDDYRRDAAQAGDEKIRRRIEGDIKLVVSLVKKLAAHLRYIEGASVDRTPWSLVQPIEKLAQQLPAETRLIVRPQWHYNYGELEVIEDYQKETEFLFTEREQSQIFKEKELPQHLYVLSFPGLERTNVLLHVNFGHEIGHPLTREYLTKEDPGYLLNIQQDVNATLPKNMLPLDRFAKAERMAKQVVSIRRRALEEITADLISVQLFGPAAIFALHEVAAFSDSLDTVSEKADYYPPWRTRLRLVSDAVNWPQWQCCLQAVAAEFKWESNGGSHVKGAVEKKIELLKQIVNDRNDEQEIQKDDRTRIAYKWVYEALPKVKEFLRDRLQPYSYSVDETSCRDIFHLLERLYYRIPPNEIVDNEKVKVADLRSIFNAGWFYRLAYLSSMFDHADSRTYFQELDTLNRLVLRAIEMSDLQRKYEAYKEQDAGGRGR